METVCTIGLHFHLKIKKKIFDILLNIGRKVDVKSPQQVNPTPKSDARDLQVKSPVYTTINQAKQPFNNSMTQAKQQPMTSQQAIASKQNISGNFLYFEVDLTNPSHPYTSV